jgi:hypothetical protein
LIVESRSYSPPAGELLAFRSVVRHCEIVHSIVRSRLLREAAGTASSLDRESPDPVLALAVIDAFHAT